MTLIAVDVEVFALCPRPSASQGRRRLRSEHAARRSLTGISPPVQEQPPCSPPSRFRGSRLPGNPAVHRADERVRFAMARQRSDGRGPDRPQRIAARRPSAPPARRRRALTRCARCPAIPDETSTRPAPPSTSTRSSRSSGRGYTGQTLRPRLSAHLRSPRATNLKVRGMSQPKILDREPSQEPRNFEVLDRLQGPQRVGAHSP